MGITSLWEACPKKVCCGARVSSLVERIGRSVRCLTNYLEAVAWIDLVAFPASAVTWAVSRRKAAFDQPRCVPMSCLWCRGPQRSPAHTDPQLPSAHPQLSRELQGFLGSRAENPSPALPLCSPSSWCVAVSFWATRSSQQVAQGIRLGTSPPPREALAATFRRRV